MKGMESYKYKLFALKTMTYAFYGICRLPPYGLFGQHQNLTQKVLDLKNKIAARQRSGLVLHSL